MNALKIGNLTARTPIIQGGMGVCVSLSGLASAVANEGGIGVISAVGIGMTEPGYRQHFRESNKIALRKEIRKARLLSDGIIGVNIMMAVSDFDDLLNVALEEHIDVAFIGAGLPLKILGSIDPGLLSESGTKFVPKVSSARAAKLIFKHWADKYGRVPDAVVVEGPLAGGHLGFSKENLNNTTVSLFELVRETVIEINAFEQQFGIEIPVIAGGGIYTGKDMADIMRAGAKGVKMGTRFVTTTECDVSDAFKQNYLSCSPEDITLIDSPVGLPGRVITNDFVKEIQQGKQKPVKCPWKCLKTCDHRKVQFCVAEALFNAAQGNFTQGFSFAGTNAYQADKIRTVKETIDLIKAEFYQEQLHVVSLPVH
ncbi:MAG: nitronate monooxygenase [Bacteroidales bacterium]|nr:nitronate monooxygenase [Bacteroidales bacterium]